MPKASVTSSRPLRPIRIITAEKLDCHDELHQLVSTVKVLEEPESETQENIGTDPVLLNLVRMRLAQIRQNPDEMEKHRQDLKADGQNDVRLDQVHAWRDFSCFSPREKAALGLAEAISQEPSGTFLNESLENARHYFEKEELISLLFAIMAVIDWSHQTVQAAAGEAFEEQSISPRWRKVANRLSKTRIILEET